MTDRIAEIRERAAKATPGPWWTGIRNRFSYTIEGPLPDSHPVAQRLIHPDAEFIAHAPDDIAYLLARLSAMTDALDPEGLAEAIADRLSWPSMHWDWRTPAAHKAIAEAVRRHVLGEEQR